MSWGRARPRSCWVLLTALCAIAHETPPPLAQPSTEWAEVDYADLLDLRQLSHSGESVGELLRRLGGRPMSSQPDRSEERALHSLLDPLVEPYAFVLPDALDSVTRAEPSVEVGWLYRPGEPQPAWAELLRSRRYVVESDGRGSLRLFLPWTGGAAPAATAAEQAFNQAWPILRHVLAAEMRRLPQSQLKLVIHPYRHQPERSSFQLGLRAYERVVTDTRPDGRRPQLDIEALQRFLQSGLQLEGARIDAGGALRMFGSQGAEPPRMLGRAVSLADLAVAYRAVAHGGLAEPYMSLDRGFSPQSSIVNYGGRLQDTGIGLVSLLCDVRFKTFSLGLDIVTGEDLRQRLRQRLPDFRTHLERLAAHPESGSMAGQQTRLWFYPDNVDLTISPQGDLLALRRVRMTAASERVSGTSLTAAQGSDTVWHRAPIGRRPPWTRATVDAINSDYDALAPFFPELADLDQVVRLLSAFTWLRQAQLEGYLLPELEALMALELPSQPTSRTFPQLIAFNALPAPGSSGPVAVFDRVSVGEGLERLNPTSGRPLPPHRRYARALAALDPADSQHAAFLAESQRYDPARLSESELDLLAYRAERLRMHRLVLDTLEAGARQQLAARQQRGEQLRVFSVGIGGLDLGMGRALQKARDRGRGVATPDAVPEGRPSAPTTQGETQQPRESWRVDSPLVPDTVMPDHGLGRAPSTKPGRREFGDHWMEVGESWLWTVLGAEGPEVRSRKLYLDGEGRAAEFERVEQMRFLRYRMERNGSGLSARLVRETAGGDSAPQSPAPTAEAKLPAGLASLQMLEVAPAEPPVGAAEPDLVAMRLAAQGTNLEADLPRGTLQRLLLGRSADLTPGEPLAGLAPLPGPLAEVETLMLLLRRSQREPPWTGAARPIAGEEDPVRVAAALRDWWASEQPPRSVVVGVDPVASPERWASAPRPDRASVSLLLPGDGFPGPAAQLRERLAAAWKAGPVVDAVPKRLEAPLLVLVSAEAPALLAARLRQLAGDPQLAGKLLAVWSLAGSLRQDLPASLLGAGKLRGLGLAEASVIDQRHAPDELQAMSMALAAGKLRVEQLPGPFLWYF